MTIPITHYVDVSVTLTPDGAPQASFSTPAFINANAVAGSVLQGPYSSVQDVLDAGFAAGSAMHAYAIALTQQNPRPRQFYSIKDTGVGPVASLAAAVAISPGAFYCVHMESRASADILAMAAAVESLAKIAIFQCNDPSMLDATNGLEFLATFGGTPADGTYRLTFTGFGLPSPVNVDVVRDTGSPAANTDLGTALAAALIAAEGGTLSDVLVLDSIVDNLDGTVAFATTDGLIGTVTVTDPESPDGLVVTVTDGDVASQLFANQYTRTALVYHATDSEMLAERWAARCLGNNLDEQQLAWSYKQLVGITGATLTNAQATVLRNANVNYFATAISTAGQLSAAFTAQGVMPAGVAGKGRPIRVTTTLDWLRARKEEAHLDTFLSEPDAVWMDDAGINRFVCASSGVNATGLGADHLIEKVVPAGQDYAGEQTPLVIAPLAADVDPDDAEDGILRITEVLYIKPSIEKVVVRTQVRLS